MPLKWKTAKKLFLQKRLGARRLRIKFKLTYEQWEFLWQRELGAGWLQLHGQRRGQYCLARFGDRGPYALGNVKIILSTENVREGKTRRYGFPLINAVLSLPC